MANVAVVINISAGSFIEGFFATLQILNNGKIIHENYNFPPIPAAPEMPGLYTKWQSILLENSRSLQAVDGQVTNIVTWETAAKKLRDYCTNTWFNRNNQAFNNLRDNILLILAREGLTNSQSVRIIIRCSTADDTENDILRRLPWHLWDLFSDHLTNAEFALFTKFLPQEAILNRHFRILAIFGSSQGLDLQQDRNALEHLKQQGAEIIARTQLEQDELYDLLYDNFWDILFFAGHSSSEGRGGTIQIREDVSLPLETLRPSLSKAVRKGLKLAIFNSCDGLRIADFLVELNIPAVIVMREPVPDKIAIKFLIYFLKAFSEGIPLSRAVREARDRLAGIENKYPAASWLPVVLINPNQPDLVWYGSPLRRLISYLGRHSFIILAIAAFALVVIIAVLQPPIKCWIFHTACSSSENSAMIEKFISFGEKEIADDTTSTEKLDESSLLDKRKGIQYFAEGSYQKAIDIFDELHPRPQKNQQNIFQKPKKLSALKDPEILIYRNNAVVRLQHTKNPSLPIYTIAVAAPLNSVFGRDILFGVAQAQDIAVNDKNAPINLEVVIANDMNDSKQAGDIAEQLSKKEILAVIGHYASKTTCEALKVYDKNTLVVISPTSSLDKLQEQDKCGGNHNKVFFRTVSSTRVEAQSLVQYLTEYLKKSELKVAVFYNGQDPYSNDLFEQVKLVLKNGGKGSVTYSQDLSNDRFDDNRLPPEVTDVDALAVFPDGKINLDRKSNKNKTPFEKAINIIKLNKGNKPVLGDSPLYVDDPDTRNLIKQNITNKISLFIAVDWHQDLNRAQYFAEQIREYWGGDLNRRTALAYEAVQAFEEALRSIISKSIPNRENIKQTLFEINAQSDAIKGSSISFDKNGNREESTTTIIVKMNNKDAKVLKFDCVKDLRDSSGGCLSQE